MDSSPFTLRPAELRDVAPIVQLIRELAEFEKLTHLLQVTPEKLRPHLFGEKPVAEAWVAELPADAVGEGGQTVVAFALFFTNFSTFLAQPGLYLAAVVQLGLDAGDQLLGQLPDPHPMRHVDPAIELAGGKREDG